MNITDEDGDTPLYAVENVETARYLVERGAVVNRRNHEGVTVCNSSIIWSLRQTPDTRRSLQPTLLKTSLMSRATSSL